MSKPYRNTYRSRSAHRPSQKLASKKLVIGLVITVLLVAGWFIYARLSGPSTPEQAANQLQFDSSVVEAEKHIIRDAITKQSKTYQGTVNVSAATTPEATNSAHILTAYVPVTNAYAVRQSVTTAELADLDVFVPQNTDDTIRRAIAETLGLDASAIDTLAAAPPEVPDTAVLFLPVEQLSPQIKLIILDDKYYLDDFSAGAIFRTAVFSGSGSSSLNDLTLNDLSGKDETLKINMTGVTALAREMMRKLAAVGGDGAYFSKDIGPFLADADITHTSNEVSFKENCEYSRTLFCSPPVMIETLKNSGINLVELTGNHNNDLSSQDNTDTINLYHRLGWGTFGGGLNAAEAAKPFVADQKNSKVAFLGYNYADSPGSGAIATDTQAGANSYDTEKAKTNIADAKQQADFVIVTVQFWECYAYPDGYVEFPQCDLPIGQQAAVFRELIDMGADMVVGTSAHQPQTYEMYNDKPIYYGLGNLYFDQTSWPGTERGIVLTHYFAGGKLLQTKLSPTVYHGEFQPRLMNTEEANYLLGRLKSARDQF